MNRYRLRNVELHIRQGLNAKQEIDFSQIKASILEDVFSNQKKPDTVRSVPRVDVRDSMVLNEMKVLYPAITTFGVSNIAVRRTDTAIVDTQKVALARFSKTLRNEDVKKLQSWLQKRYQSPQMILVTQ